MKLKVGVFFGGESVENEVSVISAIQAIHSMNKEKYDIIPIYITHENEMYTGKYIADIQEYKDLDGLLKKSTRVVLVKDGKKTFLQKCASKGFGNKVISEIDVAFPIVHGTNVEDGTLQGYLRMFNLPYVGCDVTASALGMDKYAMKVLLKENGISVLDGMKMDYRSFERNREEKMNEIEQKIGYPVIVKPINLGSSVGIGVAKDRAKLEEVLDKAFEYSMFVIIEHAILNLREINCAVLGDYEEAEASECEEPISSGEILSYEDKYVSGGSKTGKDSGAKSGGMSSLKRKLPAELLPEQREQIRKMAVDTFKILNCNGVSRIDFMIDNDNGKIYVNEINTIPGSLSFYLWEPLGKKYTELLDDLIRLALKRERELANLTFDFNTNILKNFNGGGLKGGKA